MIGFIKVVFVFLTAVLLKFFPLPSHNLILFLDSLPCVSRIIESAPPSALPFHPAQFCRQNSYSDPSGAWVKLLFLRSLPFLSFFFPLIGSVRFGWSPGLKLAYLIWIPHQLDHTTAMLFHFSTGGSKLCTRGMYTGYCNILQPHPIDQLLSNWAIQWNLRTEK